MSCRLMPSSMASSFLWASFSLRLSPGTLPRARRRRTSMYWAQYSFLLSRVARVPSTQRLPLALGSSSGVQKRAVARRSSLLVHQMAWAHHSWGVRRTGRWGRTCL